MNRYLFIRRLMGPAILLLIGVLALLHQAGMVRFWPLFWPLLLILVGVIKLAERAALAADGPPQYPVNPYAAYAEGAGAAPAPGQTATPGTAIVPSGTDEITQGGQS